MRNSWFLLLLSASIAPASAQDFTGRLVMGEKIARQEIRKLSPVLPASKPGKYLLPTKESAIAVAESLAFKRYGRKNILAQRPYETYLIDGFWYITGTLPIGYEGGTFEIILAANDGRVLRFTHDK